MSYGFLDIAMTPTVRAAQRENGSGRYWANFQGHREFSEFTSAERDFIADRDSFYMATISETGWPYLQHRGGPRGFLRVIDGKNLAFADFRGNRQYISTGNLKAEKRAALFLMDYPNRTRLKIYAHVEVVSMADRPDFVQSLVDPNYKGKPERAMIFHLDAFDWNCPQHITPRFSEDELNEALIPVRKRIADLEAENKKLKEQLAQ